MNELNKQIAEIFKEHQSSPFLMIQQLFNLLGSRSAEQNKVIQVAILYSLESIHEWNNLYFYIHKWNILDFRYNLILRMRKRLQETSPAQNVLDQSYQLKRLIQKYQEVGSPKRKENLYKEPVITELRKETISTRIRDQSQNSKTSENERINRIQKSSNEAEQETYGGDKQLKLQSLTGRPPILKKSTLAAEKAKKQSNVFQEEATSNREQQGGSKSNKINLTQLKERLSLKMNKISEQHINKGDTKANNKQMTNQKNLSQSQSQQIQQKVHVQKLPSSRSESIDLEKQKEKYNESFPPFQQFTFGSNKKQNQPEPVNLQIKPVTKLPLERKVRKIRKNSSEEISKEILNKSQQFSFMDDGYEEDLSLLHFSQIKKEPFPKQFATSSKKGPFFSRNASLSMDVYDPQKSFKKDVYQNIGKMEQDTPYFTDHKAQSNQFLSKQEMSVVQQVQCLYLFNNLLKEKRIDVQSLFESALAQKITKI